MNPNDQGMHRLLVSISKVFLMSQVKDAWTAELSLGEVPGSEGCYVEYSMQSSKGCLRLGDAMT